MFGMTKKQFLKKSKNCLRDSGIELLLIREIYSQETKGKIDFEEAHQKLEKIRKRLEDMFFQYERLKPPSKCKQMQINLLSTLIILQESVVINSEYINLHKDGFEEAAHEKLEKSIDELERFRAEFRKIGNEFDLYLERP